MFLALLFVYVFFCPLSFMFGLVLLFGSPIMWVIYLGSWKTTCLGKSCSFGLPRVPFVNCCQFMYLVISHLVLRAGYGIWLYQFLIIAYLFTFHVTWILHCFSVENWLTTVNLQLKITMLHPLKKVSKYDSLFFLYFISSLTTPTEGLLTRVKPNEPLLNRNRNIKGNYYFICFSKMSHIR